MASNRNIGFDIARSISMIYIVGMLHLSEYTGNAISHNPVCVTLIWAALGVFTFLSSYLLASRYHFATNADIITFYKKRLLRFYPLFFISSLLLALIGFNSWVETGKGLIGISPFWEPQQHTLWYIATLIFLYLATPLLAADKFVIEALSFVLFLGIAFLIDFIFGSVDPRFFYYYLVYFIGIISTRYLPKFSKRILHSKWSFWACIPFILMLILISRTNSRLLMLGGGYLGIFVILVIATSLTCYVQKYVLLQKGISFISYGSMCAYLFHREIYWSFLKLWTPLNPIVMGIYLFFIAFPVVLFCAFYIQKKYDFLFLSVK